MSDTITSEARDYCKRANISLSTLGVRALNSSRFFDRLERRQEKLAQDAEKLRAFMRENPPDDDA